MKLTTPKQIQGFFSKIPDNGNFKFFRPLGMSGSASFTEEGATA